MEWLKSLLAENSEASSKRVCMLLSCLALSIALLVMVAKGAPAESLWAITVPLAGLGGFTYVGGVAFKKDGQ